jgi:hypothetical protein
MSSSEQWRLPNLFCSFSFILLLGHFFKNKNTIHGHVLYENIGLQRDFLRLSLSLGLSLSTDRKGVDTLYTLRFH